MGLVLSSIRSGDMDLCYHTNPRTRKHESQPGVRELDQRPRRVSVERTTGEVLEIPVDRLIEVVHRNRDVVQFVQFVQGRGACGLHEKSVGSLGRIRSVGS